MARTAAALPLCLIAPPVEEALGLLLAVLLEADEVLALEELGVPLLLLELAAAWKAAKVLLGVGLTAKTIPF
jgi:hypothetical protein